MGESDRFHEFKVPKKRRFTLGEDGNSLATLVIINLVCFVFLLVMQVSYNMGDQSVESFNAQFMQWFALPSDPGTFIERPWTILSFVFSDTFGNLIRVLTNMVWLWAFGTIFQQHVGNEKLIPVYIYGGLLGGSIFILAHTLLPTLQGQYSTLLGANAGTLAVAAAATTMAPKVRFFEHIRGGISIWVFLIVYILIDIAGAKNAGLSNMLAHLGGAAAGCLFVLLLRKGNDGSIWMNKCFKWICGLFNPYDNKSRTGIKEKYFYKTGNRPPYTKTPIITEQRINDILDKINQQGVGSLSKEEKEILRKASENKDE